MPEVLVQLGDGRIARPSAVFAPSVNAGIVTLPTEATLGPRIQRHYQLVLVHAGSVHVAVDGVDRSIPAGHGGLLLPGRTEYFTFAADRETCHSWLALLPERLDSEEREALDDAAPCLVVSREMQEAVELALHIADVDEPPDYRALAAVARAGLLLYVSETRRHGGSQHVEHAAVRRARELARRGVGAGITVSDLAGEVGLSPEHLSRLFQRALSTTPSAYLREERLRRGMQLLEHTGLSVAEVAQRAGFCSPQHFARVLRASVGLSPTELRATMWLDGHG